MSPKRNFLKPFLSILIIVVTFSNDSVGQRNVDIWKLPFNEKEKLSIDFTSSHQTACKGSCLNFFGNSNIDNITEWTWYFPGAEVVESKTQNPKSICYSKTGVYDVKLIVKHDNGLLDSMVKTSYITILDTPKIDLGPDLTICSNIAVQLDATIPAEGASYLWNEGSTNSKINVSKEGLYYVSVNLAGCIISDSIQIVHKQAPVVDFGSPKIPCFGDSISTIDLDVSRPNATYLWDNGSKEGSIKIKGEGLYWVIVSSNGCETKKKINIKYLPLPEVSLKDSTKSCENNKVVLEAFVEGATYKWDNGSVSPTKSAESGWNIVEVSLDGCSLSDSTFVEETKLPKVELGKDTVLCDELIQLNVPNIPEQSYLWSTGSIINSTMVKSTGVVWLKIELDNCSVTDSLKVLDCTNSGIIDFEIPNVFSPNGDNINDKFFIKNKGVKEILGTIVTRWGQVVYNWKGIDDSWDGHTIAGDKLAEGNYFYYFQITDNNGRYYVFKGVIFLFR